MKADKTSTLIANAHCSNRHRVKEGTEVSVSNSQLLCPKCGESLRYSSK